MGVIAALVILAATVGPLLLSYRQGAAAVRRSSLAALGLQLARQVLEEAKREGSSWEAIASSPPGEWSPVSDFPGFSYRLDVTEPVPGELKRVQVTVAFRGRPLVELRGLIFRDEL